MIARQPDKARSMLIPGRLVEGTDTTGVIRPLNGSGSKILCSYEYLVVAV